MSTEIIDWIKKENLYNKDVYRPILLIALLVTLGYAGFGTVYDRDNMMLSAFIYGALFVFLMFLMFLCPIWLPFLHPKTNVDQNKALQHELCDIKDVAEKRKFYRYLTQNPKPFHKATLSAIIFLGFFMLVACLITRAWIHLGELVVIPSSFSSLLDWLRTTNAVNWFIEGEYLNTNYVAQSQYAQTAYSEGINLLQFYRLLMILPVTCAVLTLLWYTSAKGNENSSKINFVILFIWIFFSFIFLFSSPDLLIPVRPLDEFYNQGGARFKSDIGMQILRIEWLKLMETDLGMQILRIEWLKVLGHATVVSIMLTIGLKLLVDIVRFSLTKK